MEGRKRREGQRGREGVIYKGDYGSKVCFI